MKYIYHFLVFFIFLNYTAYSQTFTDKLIAHYPLDGNANDVSGHGYHGFVNGAVLTTDRFNNPNSAYYFDGINDNIIIPNSFDLLPKTISFWFNAQTIDSNSRVVYVSDNPNLNYGITAIVIKTISGKPTISTHITSSRDTALIMPNAWYNFIITVNSDSTHFYINGTKLKSRKITGFPKSNTGENKTFLGSHRQGNTTSIYFNGKIDDVKIYNREFTKEEIKAPFINPMPLNLGKDFCLKAGQTSSISIPGFDSYSWSNGSTGSTLLINKPGTYSLSAVESNGNRYFGSITVTACPVPDFTYTFDCLTNTYLLQTNISFPYDQFHWKYEGLLVYNKHKETVQFLNEGINRVTLNVYKNGEEFTITKIIDFTKSVTPHLGRDTSLCSGQTLLLQPATLPGTTLKWSDGSIGPSMTVYSAGNYWVEATRGNCTIKDEIAVTYTPSFTVMLGNDVALCTGSSVTLKPSAPNGVKWKWSDGSSNSSLTVQQPGVYWVEATLGNCTERDEIVVTQLPVPSVNLGVDKAVCTGEIVQLDASFPNATYRWQDGSTSPTYLVSKSGIYQVTVTNENGCSTSDAVEITFKPIPIVNLGTDQIVCEGDTVIIGQTYNGASYKWQDGSSNAKLAVNKTGLYTQEVSMNGCTSSDDIFIRFEPLPYVNLGKDTTLCIGQTLSLDVTIPNASYRWQDGSTAATFTVSKEGVYWVEVTNELNCTLRDEIQIFYLTPPAIELGKDTTLCYGETLAIGQILPGVTYMWQDGSTEPLYKVSKPGIYKVIASLEQCGEGDAITVTFKDCKEGIFIPNIITPNGDALNDQFYIHGLTMSDKWELTIYDRWGKRLLYMNDYKNNWDGTSLPEGTYYYHLVNLNTHKAFKGWVELIR
ncbi:gliding motility-associated C-terminal domain-containing protein [Rufibacter ruber]|uniref:T9SS type B sorting domain-containing protein n=1 Tax=Rufibacter ruber TaxID=1783499 RepID=UPI00083472F5|nr:gliding motility-associated C-terminal domain-containing protein [Rufibacter ruber]